MIILAFLLIPHLRSHLVPDVSVGQKSWDLSVVTAHICSHICKDRLLDSVHRHWIGGFDRLGPNIPISPQELVSKLLFVYGTRSAENLSWPVGMNQRDG